MLPLLIIAIPIIVIIIAILDSQKERIAKLLFAKKRAGDSDYICPKCGSDEWKFPNPLKPSEGTINLLQLVNIYRECGNCEYVGIFFLKGKNERIPFKKEMQRKRAERKKGVLFGLIIVISIGILIIAHPLIGAAAGLFMLKSYDEYYKRKMSK